MVHKPTKQYMEYLIDQYYLTLAKEDRGNNESFMQRYVNSILDEERDKWKDLSFEEIENILIEDKAYAKLSSISSEIFDKARRKKAGEKKVQVDDTVYKELKEEVISTYNEVREINKEAASDILSETLLEIDYIYNNSQFESLRLSHELGTLDLLDLPE